jgi:phospholipid/cholesterol/gamma-HCH transport system ATP-binding protein
VFVEGDEISALEGPELSRVRRRIGFLFQNAALFDSISVGENVAFPLRRHTRLGDREVKQRATEKLAAVGLEAEYDKMPSALSGGMRKRAGLARALALDPELLFLDEPTAGLDPIGAARFDELTRELADTLHLTVFLITHDLDTLYAICDRVAVIADGKVIAVGTIPELLESDHPWIQEYFNGPRGRAAKTGLERGKSVDSRGQTGE